jgi:hypothetical protein
MVVSVAPVLGRAPASSALVATQEIFGTRINDTWVKAGTSVGVLVLTVLLAPIIGRKVEKMMSTPHRPERTRALAGPTGRFVSTMLLATGLVAVIGILSPDSLSTFPVKLVEFVPRLLLAVLLILVGSTAANLGSNIVGVAAVRATGKPQPAIVRLTRASIMLLILLLAVGQLGVNTKVVDTLTQAVLFSTMAMIALLGALGGRDLASEISTGRYVRRIVAPGDSIRTAEAEGVVAEVHAATIEIIEADGSHVHVPHSLAMKAPIRVQRAQEL